MLSDGRGQFAHAISTARTGAARVWRAAVAPHDGEAGQVATTVRLFVWFCMFGSAAYAVFYYVYDRDGLEPAWMLQFCAVTIYAILLVAVGRGAVTLAAVIATSGATAQALVCTAYLGWTAGYLLFLIAAGELVFVVFTDKQKAFRRLFLVTSATVFACGQVFLDPELAPYHFPEHVQEVLFSVNAMGTGLILFVLAALTYQRARAAQEQAHASAARAEYLANTDALTGLANRRPLAAELERVAVPGGAPYCVAIADLDGFKDLNDTFGHDCGDRVLSALGRTLRARVRATDLVGRWGGEEFIFVLPSTTLVEAQALVERIRVELAASVIDCRQHTHAITASFGIADGAGGAAASRVLRRADDAMYDAKRAGRNKVCVRAYADSGAIPVADMAALNVPTRALRVRGQKA